MNDLALRFVILPCAAACIIAALVFDWRLGAAAFFGALGLLFARASLPVGISYLSVPVFLGVALGAAAATVALLLRPSLDVWGRLIAALVFTAAISFAHLLYAMAGL